MPLLNALSPEVSSDGGLYRYRVATAAVLLLLGCRQDATAPPEVSPGEVLPEMVTAAAAAALGQDGYFRFSTPTLQTDQISLVMAREQALQFAKYATNNILLRGAIEESRGGYWTDPHLLTLCRDTYLVRSQLHSVPADSLPAVGQAMLQRQFGPQWLIPLCGSKGEPQMTVQIAVDGNDIRFQNNEPVEPYSFLSDAYFGRGVPLNWPDALPISAERAVRFVYDQLGVRISEVPELYFRGSRRPDDTYARFQIGSARYCNRWRIVLEHEVALHGATSQTVRTTNEVFVGALACRGTDVTPLMQLPAIQQRAEVGLAFFDTGLIPLRAYVVRASLDSPIDFELAARVLPP